MKRRIISIISVFAVVCSLFQAPILAAKTSIDENQLSVLKSLDILDDELPKRVTYGVFLDALMGFVLENDERAVHTPESFARSTGMIESDADFEENAVVSLDDAVKYGVILLGYNSTIIPNIKYNSIASSQNLLKGVSISDTLKPADMVVFLYNLLDAEPLKVESLGDKGTIYNASGKHTLISMYRDIYVCNGIITADEYSSIYSDKGVGENSIRIGEYTFDLGCEYDRALLGCNVTAYVKDDGENDPVVIHLLEREARNKRFTIQDEYIVSVNDNYTIVEYEDERGRIDDLKLAEHPKVIINGVFYADYTKADLMPEDGYVEFIDNNSDGKYEIVNVKSYKTIIVDSINVDKGEITDKLNLAEALKLENVEYSVKKDGADIKLKDIAIGDVLSVAMSRGTGERVCEILVSSERASFTVSRMSSTERKIYDDSKMYVLSHSYIRYLTAAGKEVNVGSAYEFFIDAFGKIVYSRAMFEDTYALFFRVRPDVEYEGSIEYLDLDGKWKTAKLAKKVTLDSETESAYDMYGVLENMDPQVVKIRLNADGFVREIRTATETPLARAKHIEDRFTKTPETSYIYRPVSNTFANILYLKNGARLFVMPKDAQDKYVKEAYYVADASSYFVEEEFAVSAYDVDRFAYAQIFSVKGSNESRRMPDNLFVVTGIRSIIDPYGDACQRIEGCGSGYKDISFLTANTEVLNGVKKGDVINFMLDNSGRVSAVSTPIARLQEQFTQYNNGGAEYYSIHKISAKIAEIDFENNRIILSYGPNEEDEITFPFTSTINCMEYNKTTQSCDLINYDSFTKNDKVLVVTKHYAIRDMIRICE